MLWLCLWQLKVNDNLFSMISALSIAATVLYRIILLTVPL